MPRANYRRDIINPSHGPVIRDKGQLAEANVQRNVKSGEKEEKGTPERIRERGLSFPLSVLSTNPVTSFARAFHVPNEWRVDTANEPFSSDLLAQKLQRQSNPQYPKGEVPAVEKKHLRAPGTPCIIISVGALNSCAAPIKRFGRTAV